MKVGIIGAGNIGGALARRFTELGHEVSIANSRGPGTLHEVEAETGATAVTVREAAQGNNVVVVTIPEKKVSQLPGDLFDGGRDDLVVIDTGNYYPRQRDGRSTRSGSGHSRERVGIAADRAFGRKGVQQHLRAALARSRSAARVA